MKLGKTTARPGAIKLQFRKYANLSVLPTPPAEFGHDDLVQDWGVLGNDQCGNCVFAGGDHEHILWNKEAGRDVSFDTTTAVADYSAVTGYDPNNSATDNGTDMQLAASYRRTTGLIDANGNRHKIAAYLEIKKGDIQEHLIATYLFQCVGIGIQFPQSAEDQFNQSNPWDVVQNSPIVGGHYIPCIARREGMLWVVTWGKVIPMTDEFFSANNDESVVYLDDEFLSGGKSLEGFDLEQLKADFSILTS